MAEKKLTIGKERHQGEGGRQDEDADTLNTFSYGRHGETQITLAVVADGVGGRSRGEVASRMATEAIQGYVASHLSVNVLHLLEQAILFAGERVYATSRDMPPNERMGTTVAVAAIASEDGKPYRLYIANIGDSRVYLLRDGKLYQLTVDHTWAQEAIEAGRLTEEEAKKHPNRHVITRVVGGEPKVNVDLRLCWENKNDVSSRQGMALQEGDMILLCTDGLHDVVEDSEIQLILNQYDPQRAARRLIKLVRSRQGVDNVTIQIIGVPGGKKRLPISPVAGSVILIGILSAFWLISAFIGGNGSRGLTPIIVASPTDTLMPSVGPTGTPRKEKPTPPPIKTPTPLPMPTSTALAPTPTQPAPTMAPSRTPTPMPTATRIPPSTPTPECERRAPMLFLPDQNATHYSGVLVHYEWQDGQLCPGDQWRVNLNGNERQEYRWTVGVSVEWALDLAPGTYIWMVDMLDASGTVIPGMSSGARQIYFQTVSGPTCDASKDGDGDGVNDCDDKCPTQPGSSRNGGCQ